MRKNKLVSFITAAVMIMGLGCGNSVSAAEVQIFHDELIGEYAIGDLGVAPSGGLNGNPAYASGEGWGASSGAGDWYADGEDCLVFQSAIFVEGETERAIVKKVPSNNIPADAEVTFTYEFQTAPESQQSSNEIWFRVGATDPATGAEQVINLFQYLPKPDNQPEFGFASSTSYPFTAKDFDRDPDNMTFTYDTAYKINIILKPNEDGSCRMVVEQYTEGEKTAVGIIEKCSGFTMANFSKIQRLFFNQIKKINHTVNEPLLFMKGIDISASYPDKKPEAVCYPADGGAEVPLNTDCYLDFPNPVEEVTPSQASIDNGGSIDSVELTSGGRRVKLNLSGLLPNTTYTIQVTGIKETVADTSFDYQWSFTTGGAVAFSEATLNGPNGSGTVVLSETFDTDIMANLVTKTDPAFDNGTAWGSTWGNEAKKTFVVGGGALEVNTSGAWARVDADHPNEVMDIRISKKFTPISAGESLKLTSTINLNDFEAGSNSAVGISLGESGENPLHTFAFMLNSNVSKQAIRAYATGGKGGVHGWYTDNGDSFVSVDGKEDHAQNLNASYWQVGVKEGAPAIESAKLSGDVKLTFTMEPNAAGTQYTCTSTLKSADAEYQATKTITKAYAMSLDRVIFAMNCTTGNSTKPVLTVKDITVTKGSLSMVMPEVGENKLYIPFENAMPGTPFSVNVMIVERSGENGYGEIRNVSLIPVENQTADKGYLECPFTITDASSKIDVFVLNSADGGVLLSSTTSLAEAK